MRNNYDLLFNAAETYSKNTITNGSLELHRAIFYVACSYSVSF